MPEDLEPLGYRSEDLDETELAAWRAARDACVTAYDAARDADTTEDGADEILTRLVRAKIISDQAGVETLPPEAESLAVFLGDMPLVDPSSVAPLFDAVEAGYCDGGTEKARPAWRWLSKFKVVGWNLR